MPKCLAQSKTDAKAEGWAEWIRSEADERAVLDGCWFDLDAANHWVEFIEGWFVHTMGGHTMRAGERYTLLDWQKYELVMPLFGWKRTREQPHLRRYSKGDVFIAKKQGKSAVCGVLACAFLLKGGERSEVYGVAHTRDQASIIYREAAAQATKSRRLGDRLKPLDSVKRIVYAKTNSFYQAVAGENSARGIEGINPNLILFDEIHVQRERKLYDALTYASSARENSLMLSVSTVGVADETTIWWEQYEYAKGILAGTITDHSRFAYIAQADEECKTSAEKRADPAQWRKAMPALGVTVLEDKVREAVLEAENSPAKLNSLLRYMFNIPTAQIDAVVPMDKWDACEHDGPFPDLTGRFCIGGLDMASSEDLTSFALYFPPLEDEERGYLKTWFWCPSEKIREREQKSLAHYGVWVRAGWIMETDGARLDQNALLVFIREQMQKYQVKEIAYDKWNALALVGQLEHDPVELVLIEQTYAGVSGFCKAFMDAIVEGRLWHDGNPVMTWCCANAGADMMDADTWKFSKKQSKEKIDGVIASSMAVGRAVVHSLEPSVYESRGMLTI